MIARFTYQDKEFSCDLSKPIDLSIETGRVKCFHAPDFIATPYQSGDFVGSINSGAPVNFYNVSFNPHGNGTHTESLGHITPEQESINKQLTRFHFFARLISIKPIPLNGNDLVIRLEDLQNSLDGEVPEALVIRTLPNDEEKLTRDYSDTNPPYIEAEAMEFLVEKGVRHFLIDLPSVDREYDNGVLAAHHIFWGLDSKKPSSSRNDCTITEMIFVPDQIADGLYLLNIQVPPFPLDAAPSRPTIYSLTSV